MLSWALSFLIIGLIAGLLGLTGIAGPAIQIEWILFVAFMILISISLLVDRRSPPLSIRNRLPKSRHWKFCLPKRIGCPRRSRRLMDSFTDWKPKANSKMPHIPRQVTKVRALNEPLAHICKLITRADAPERAESTRQERREP